MKKSEAATHLHHMLFAIQRLRSEVEQSDTDAILWPWVWGIKCPISALVRVVDKYDATGELPGISFYNMVVIATRLEPMICAQIHISEIIQNGNATFPDQADPDWIRGWEAEDEMP